MYYIIGACEGGDKIVEQTSCIPSIDSLQEMADEMGISLYVIDGQHTGVTVQPESSVGVR